MAQPALPPKSDPAPARDLDASGVAPASGRVLASPRSLARLIPARAARVDLGRRLLLPLAIALVPLWWVADATYRASLTTIGRDQGIFQYIAWAVSQGDVDYRDVRDVNGPLVHLVHEAFMALGGWDEHRFHVLDLTVTGATFAFAGACLAGFVRGRLEGLRGWAERAAWAFAAWVILSGQHHLYLYWNQAQRESFCDWFLLPAIGLGLARPAKTPRAQAARIALMGALSIIPWFGKPSFAVFTLTQLVALMADDGLVLRRRARLAWFSAGGALGALLPGGYLLWRGDLFAFLRVSLHDVPLMYRFIWVKSPHEILGMDGQLTSTATGLAAAALVLSLVATRELPRRALVLGLAPLAAVANVLAQAKGFGYHFHPLTATTALSWLAVVAMLWQKHRDAGRARPFGRWMALGAGGALALTTVTAMGASPHLRHVWILAGGATPYLRGMPEYLDQYKTYDFFPLELREGAAYVAAHTQETDRVQTYGMDPYLLFLARRRSATPYIYAYDLNADAALEGGWWARPTEAQAEAIRAMRDAHEMDLLTRLRAAPPAAFVFVDRSPLMSDGEAAEDFAHCCATSAAWVRAHYTEAERFGPVHVWLKN